jgi:hypothetical protein
MIVRWMSAAVIALAMAFAPAVVGASELNERLKRWDEGPQDASFLKFRNNLKDIIARKDASALFKVLASDIKIDFGGFGGGPEFHKMWKPYDKDSKVWAALSLVVEGGGNFDAPVQFSAPYVSSAFPSDLDEFEHLVVTADNAVMRAAPKPDAAVVRKLDLDILTIVKSASKPQHEAGPNDWSEVKDAKGVHGFVLDRDVRSPLDYRIQFVKQKGRWVIASFVAGD